MNAPFRLRIVSITLYLLFSLVLGRLFYWQIIQGDNLASAADSQYQIKKTLTGSRGSIFTSDGALLVGNEVVYRLFAEPQHIDADPEELADLILQAIQNDLITIHKATTAAQIEEVLESEKIQLVEKIKSRKDASWVGLFPKLSSEGKKALESQNISGIGFEPYEIRSYPEASMAAHVTGFVGKNQDGHDLGYFGIEGALEKELKPRQKIRFFDKDILGDNFSNPENTPIANDGRDVVLTIRRDVQYAVEKHLQKGIERYGATKGEVIVYQPRTGEILAMAASPHYAQASFADFEQKLYKNPSITEVFEPGSTFKVLTVAAGIESGVIEPETTCDSCDGPRRFGAYSIKTWNGEYHPDISMTDALVKSDNTAMVFIEEKIGADEFRKYLESFEIGTATTQELQEDVDTPFPQQFRPVEVANMSFGQGIGVTSLQLVRAVASIANQGNMMQPHIIKKVIDPVTEQEIEVQPEVIKQLFSRETTEKTTQMMVETANSYSDRWAPNLPYTVAGKTGTAQIAAGGEYDPDKTIASMIGFSPAQNPEYVMYVKLVEPTTSPWGSATAAPLWYDIAEEINLLLNIPPDAL